MAILRQTKVEFRRPASISDEPMRRQNTPTQAHVCYAHGHLSRMKDIVQVNVTGVFRVTQWQWLGKLPSAVNPASGWEVHANAHGKDMRFVVSSADRKTHWQLMLEDVT